ncbi:MAG TPA: Rrf2 family transcriptional regulator [Pseudobdellovibrionaceae bacterium]|nr:Rrf2 family transcriptional regulator [Pseudobdellovibrionaceae bacterium]
MQLNRRVEYALMALKFMDDQKKSSENSTTAPGLISAKKIADTLKTPYELTARIMQTLSQKDFIDSIQGQQGGYRIQKDLSKISVFDLIEALEGPMALVKCQDKEHQCSISSTCNILHPLEKLNQRVQKLYQNTSLLEVIRDI